MMQCLLGVLTLGKTRLWARKRVCLRENTLPRLNLFYVNGVTMSHNTLPTPPDPKIPPKQEYDGIDGERDALPG